ncbi:MAG: M23 family metallopeptidase [Treponemataceae bacterium]|nr:M23 family metallopeptidase [Treponemataceae bacterium]
MKHDLFAKRLAGAVILLLAAALLPAATVSFQEEQYGGTITYNEAAKPGEAVFARMSLKFARNFKKRGAPEMAAVLQLYQGGKKIDSAQFYFVNSKLRRQTAPELLAGLPLSTWLSAEEGYSIRILFATGASPEKEMALPFTLEGAEYNSETLLLDDKNSAIKQDMSAERLAQIERLNAILGTITPQDIYTQKPFIRPVQSTRLTACFGDRRIYQYTNGKSSTSLHYGNDYGVPEGTDVSACGDGRVVMAEFRISTGWSVVIEHLPGLYSLYYHLSALSVSEGQMVRQGEKIGASGSTGLATGPHLHWEVRLNMCAVRPEFFMQDFTFQEPEN